MAPVRQVGIRRLKLRQRVLLVFVGLATIILLVNSITVVLLHRVLVGQVDKSIQAQAVLVDRTVLSEGADHKDAPANLSLLSSGPMVIRLQGGGQPGLTRGDSGGQAILAAHHQMPAGLTTVDGWRFYTVATSTGRITVGESLDVIAGADGTISAEVVLGSAVILALLVIFFAGSIAIGVRPFAEIARVARDVTAGERSERVVVPRRLDGTEVGDVAVAFNAMLSGLEQALSKEKALSTQLRQFVADAGHELRTPLTSITGYAELLQRGGLADGDELDALARVRSEGARMQRLIASLLHLTSLAGTPAPRLGPVDLGRLLRELAGDHQLAVDTGGHAVEVHGPQHLVVTADTDQIAEVITNLLTNLRRHTPDGTSATFTLRQCGSEACMSYEDNGPGVPDPEQIFTRFWQADHARRGPGSGLGMSISNAIIAAHGGRITAHHGANGGLAVDVVLRLAP